MANVILTFKNMKWQCWSRVLMLCWWTRRQYYVFRVKHQNIDRNQTFRWCAVSTRWKSICTIGSSKCVWVCVYRYDLMFHRQTLCTRCFDVDVKQHKILNKMFVRSLNIYWALRKTARISYADLSIENSHFISHRQRLSFGRFCFPNRSIL